MNADVNSKEFQEWYQNKYTPEKEVNHYENYVLEQEDSYEPTIADLDNDLLSLYEECNG